MRIRFFKSKRCTSTCDCHRCRRLWPFAKSWRERFFDWLLRRPPDGWAYVAGQYAEEAKAWREKCEKLQQELGGVRQE